MCSFISAADFMAMLRAEDAQKAPEERVVKPAPVRNDHEPEPMEAKEMENIAVIEPIVEAQPVKVTECIVTEKEIEPEIQFVESKHELPPVPQPTVSVEEVVSFAKTFFIVTV